ncbi:MAG: hypothetical protein JWS10_2698 [Cypionkella sp.]|uniref:hypothetical protein n=1 Tax=Cypionkella sp. TaxID=2811411 RepID=UPI002630956D|nr:hypothetical protein [Cypionkella sp.]MDB5660083.1 hypothetical protein [Cypionkella sp.]MDB5666080.1 hypothetical protein [Cypionkella sp.]
MLKHRGFPGRLTGTDFQFVIRRANMKAGAAKIIKRERFADRKSADRAADKGFMAALWACFGEEVFERGNLDAGRLSWLFGREVVPAEDPFDPASYDALLKINLKVAQVSFPEIFAADAEPMDFGDWDDDEDQD